ncbi:LolF [Desulforapulum autotrophicum HRM2]|uniref:LolF n=1 Tax=Desulforapulum autotrophicum (strain ATCC 43914 / DSM 3382 / VKM B-1955 / HRM2) TaxID=177437 RepID=C0QCP5_DESAH|nr:outer membrane lipoprotein-sorting protein [Desulforapulum autotrophicum]ACN15122.1 LolF [Desulforapulum autotrophicum HRM2]
MEKFYWIFFSFFAFSLFFYAGPVLSENITPQQILQYADEIRSPQADYSVMAKITSQKPNKKDKIAIYEILMKGQDNTIIKTLSPEVDKGTSLLMLRYDLWVFLQTISKPLRISLQQRLFGEAANGDVARANFSGDYDPELIDIVTIKGKTFYLLELTAKNEKVTYHKVKLWVMKDTYYPLKGEFYAFSGKLLKICYYTNYKLILDKMRPTRLVLDNPLVKGQRTVIDYDNMILDTFSDKIFTKNYMKKLKY